MPLIIADTTKKNKKKIYNRGIIVVPIKIRSLSET